MFVLCCRCGKSPLSFARKNEWREYRRAMANAFPDWPDDLKITDYEWDEDPEGDGPSVKFVRKGKHEPDDG